MTVEEAIDLRQSIIDMVYKLEFSQSKELFYLSLGFGFAGLQGYNEIFYWEKEEIQKLSTKQIIAFIEIVYKTSIYKIVKENLLGFNMATRNKQKKVLKELAVSNNAKEIKRIKKHPEILEAVHDAKCLGWRDEKHRLRKIELKDLIQQIEDIMRKKDIHALYEMYFGIRHIEDV